PHDVGDSARFHFAYLNELFGHGDFSADAAAFNVAIVHRLCEHGRHDKLTAIAGFDLVINLQRARRRAYEKYRAVLADIDVVNAIHWRRAGAGRRIDNFESAWQKIDDRHVRDRFPL